MQLKYLKDKEGKPGERNCRLQKCRFTHVSLGISFSFFFLKNLSRCGELLQLNSSTFLGSAQLGQRLQDPRGSSPCREPRLVAPCGKLILASQPPKPCHINAAVIYMATVHPV